MLSYWTIKLFNAVFVYLVAIGALWLFLSSLFYRPPEKYGRFGDKPGNVSLHLTRKGKPYYRMDLKKGVYLVGTAREADVMLLDPELPEKLGELIVNDECYFLTHGTDIVLYNGDHLNKALRKRLHSGDRLSIKDYEIQIEKSITGGD